MQERAPEPRLSAHQLGAVFEGRLPSIRELTNMTEELGPEMATGILLKILQDSKLHGEFAKKIREADPSNSRGFFRKIEVAVLASNLFVGGRAWGDHVSSWRSWARDLGFTTEVIETRAGASVSENSRTLRDFLNTNPHPRRILVSYGQGASEIRYLLHRLRALNGLDEWNGVRGWVNVCGSFYGSSWNEYRSRSGLRRFSEKLKLKWAGRSPSTLFETSSANGLWRESPPHPRGMTTVNLVGLPLRAEIPAGLHYPYEILAKSQPNDGAVQFLESIAHPGFVVPIEGMSHRAPDSKLKPFFQRTLLLLGEAMEAERGVRAELELE